MVVPILLILAFLGTKSAQLWNWIIFNANVASSYLNQKHGNRSLAENTIVTGLIVAKILIIYRNISPSSVGCVSKLGRDIVPILIESAAITFTVQLVQTLTSRYRFASEDSAIFSVVNDLTVILFVRGFILLSIAVLTYLNGILLLLYLLFRLCREFRR